MRNNKTSDDPYGDDPIIEYVVVSARSTDGFHEQLNQWISNGYKLQGGVCITRGEKYTYHQAVIKWKET